MIDPNYAHIERFVLAGIDAMEWPEGTTVELTGIEEVDVWDMETLMIGLTVWGSPAEGTDDRADMDDALAALTCPQLRMGDRMAAAAVAWNVGRPGEVSA